MLSIWESCRSLRKTPEKSDGSESDQPAVKDLDSDKTKKNRRKRTQKDKYNLRKQLSEQNITTKPDDDDPRLVQPSEELFSSGSVEEATREVLLSVDCQKEFGRTTGLIKKKEITTRYETKLLVEKQIITREIVTDLKTGKTVRASLDDIGPKQSKITWATLAWLCLYVVKFCIPVDRISKILSTTGCLFSSGRICEYLSEAAKTLLPVYLYLIECLSESSCLYGDDSRTNVVEIRDKIREGRTGLDDYEPGGIIDQANSLLPRVSWTKDGMRHKKQLSVSVVIGKSDPLDVRSTIFLYRTHVGDLGNIISSLLSMRRPKYKKLNILTDLLSANKPDPEIAANFQINFFGCGYHARRPFFRYREREPEHCYYILRCFAVLSKIEKRIQANGLTQKRTLRYRDKYSRKIWDLIYLKCCETAEKKFPYPGHALHKGDLYIIKNFHLLTRYLDHPEMLLSNNLSERLLRSEKIMLISSKFRKTEKGRTIIDIIRTLTMTCSAANVSTMNYLIYVFQNKKNVATHPEEFTPFAYAKKLDQQNLDIAC